MLFTCSGTKLVEPHDIQHGVVTFYKGLLGSPAQTDRGMNLVADQKGSILGPDKRRDLVRLVDKLEVVEALSL